MSISTTLTEGCALALVSQNKCQSILIRSC